MGSRSRAVLAAGLALLSGVVLFRAVAGHRDGVARALGEEVAISPSAGEVDDSRERALDRAPTGSRRTDDRASLPPPDPITPPKPVLDDGREWRIEVKVVEVIDVGDEAWVTPPMAGAEVRFELTLHRETLASIVAATDARGLAAWDFTESVRPLSAARRSSLFVSAAAGAPGHWSDETSNGVRPEGGTIAKVLSLARQPAVRGRVVDAEGSPVADATVKTRIADSGWRHGDVCSAADGRFELHPQGESEVWSLYVAADGVGTAITPPFTAARGAELELGDVVVCGSGSVGGVVVDGSGGSVEGVTVVAIGGTVDPQSSSRSHVGSPVATRADGADTGSARTAADGTFVIGGLAPGSYRLRTPYETSAERGGERLHALGDRRAVLVAEVRRARFIVRDENDAPVAGARVMLRTGERTHSRWADERGVATWFGATGQEVVACASAPGCAPADGVIRFGAGEREEYELGLTLRPFTQAPGALAVTVEGDDGAPLEPATVSLRTALGGQLEEWHRRGWVRSKRLEPLAPGRYQIEAFADFEFDEGSVLRTLFVPATTFVDVAPGATTACTIRLRQAGRLRFTVRAPNGFAKGRFDGGLEGAVMERVTSTGVDSSFGRVRVDGLGNGTFGRRDFSDFEVPYIAAPQLDPGDHCLRFTAPGYVAIERSFTVRAGEYSDVELALVADR